jgi:hypothetical protein
LGDPSVTQASNGLNPFVINKSFKKHRKLRGEGKDRRDRVIAVIAVIGKA